MNPIHQCLAWQSMTNVPFAFRSRIPLRILMLVIKAGGNICIRFSPIILFDKEKNGFVNLRRDSPVFAAIKVFALCEVVQEIGDGFGYAHFFFLQLGTLA